MTMNKSLNVAVNKLLIPTDLHEEIIWDLITKAKKSSVDYVDIFFQHGQGESWVLEDRIVKSGNFGIDSGIGVRVISGDKTGFAYADAISLQAINSSLFAAQSVIRSGVNSESAIHVSATKSAKNKIIENAAATQIYSADNPLLSLPEEEKVNILKSIDIEARKQDPRVIQVIASLNAAHEIVLIVASDGTLAADVRPLVRLNVTVIVEEKGRREKGFTGGGGRMNYAIFLQNDLALHYAREAVRVALINLAAKPTPAGKMPVVLGKGWPAVLIHEAIGHGLEGDAIRKESSVFADKLGERVASPLCTIVDQGNIPDRRGSLFVDDEGTPTQRTILIEDGILRGFMQDKLNARLMNTQSTGNARRESYAHLPIPRMTNTFMLPGNSDPQEIIASVKDGIYAVNFSGGQVDVTSGEFVFSMSEAYLIKNGEISHPVKGASLIGKGIEVLHNITMVGNDLALDEGVGMCGKEGQSIPVGVGQPTLKIESVTVGGTH